MGVLPILALPAPHGLLPLVPARATAPVQLAPPPVVSLDTDALRRAISEWIAGLEARGADAAASSSPTHGPIHASLSSEAQRVVLASFSESRLL